jgi:hypothetical protein
MVIDTSALLAVLMADRVADRLSTRSAPIRRGTSEQRARSKPLR